MTVCWRCGRKPKKLKVAPFTETFSGIVMDDYWGALCPSCAEGLNRLYINDKIIHRKELNEKKKKFINELRGKREL